MSERRFVYRSRLPVSAAEAFAWHERPGAFERLVPSWASVTVLDRRGGIRKGDRMTIRMPIAGLPIRWIAEHDDYQEGVEFADRQLSGPFAYWQHRHRFEPHGKDSTLHDEITYRLPGGACGDFFAASYAERMLARVFRFRHRRTIDDMNAHARFADQPRLTVAITGASGLIGGELAAFLSTGGHRAVRLSRAGSKPKPGVGEEGTWNVSSGEITLGGDAPLDAVVHLAGESIAVGRWNAKRKAAIRNSRVEPTQKLCEHLASRRQKPAALICASAIGYYGSRGDEVLSEESPPGDDFLAEVCQAWEAAAAPAREAGIRVVHARLGVVLSPKGGALAKMLTPFRMGVGGVVGSGKQYWSWIALDDVVGGLHHALCTESLQGPVNLTAPNPVTNAEFTEVLGRVLRRPTVLPLPAFAARLALGEMADALLLSSARVMPARLQETGYPLRFEHLEAALRFLLGR